MSRRATGLALIVAGLALVLLLSVSVGARPIPVDRVWGLVWSPDGSDDAIIVHDLRIPRTILGLIVGAALGVGGALMQALTRNPLADPGLLGVNAGAAAAVVTATAIARHRQPARLRVVRVRRRGGRLGRGLRDRVGGAERRDAGAARARGHGDHASR